MRGYTDKVDFEAQTIGGWALSTRMRSTIDARWSWPTSTGTWWGRRTSTASGLTRRGSRTRLRASRSHTRQASRSARPGLGPVGGQAARRRRLEVRATTTGHEPVRVPASSGDRCARQSTASARRRSPGVGTSGAGRAGSEQRSCRPSVAVAGSRRWECEDRSARVGHNGHLFLVQGTNRLSALYDDTSDYGTAGGARGRARQWLRVFSERDAECRGRGLGYVQTIIPEKLGVLRASAPIPIAGPSPLYRFRRRVSRVGTSTSVASIPFGMDGRTRPFPHHRHPFHGRRRQADVPSARGGRGPGSPDLRGRHRAPRTSRFVAATSL